MRIRFPSAAVCALKACACSAALFGIPIFAIRRTPWPINLGRPYTKAWEVVPLTELTGPIAVRLEDANISEGVALPFKGLSRKSLQARAVTLKAPDLSVPLRGTATLADGASSWTFDRTIPAKAWSASAQETAVRPN